MHGALDILVCNAGAPKSGPVTALTPQQARAQMLLATALLGEPPPIARVEDRELGPVGERTRHAADMLRRDIEAALSAA